MVLKLKGSKIPAPRTALPSHIVLTFDSFADAFLTTNTLRFHLAQLCGATANKLRRHGAFNERELTVTNVHRWMQARQPTLSTTQEDSAC